MASFIPDDHAMNAAAMAGAAAGTLANRAKDTFLRRLGEGLVGALAGIFCGPAVADAAGATVENTRIGIAFLIGMCGIALATGVLDAVKGFSFKDWLGRFMNGGKFPHGPTP